MLQASCLERTASCVGISLMSAVDLMLTPPGPRHGRRRRAERAPQTRGRCTAQTTPAFFDGLPPILSLSTPCAGFVTGRLTRQAEEGHKGGAGTRFAKGRAAALVGASCILGPLPASPPTCSVFLQDEVAVPRSPTAAGHRRGAAHPVSTRSGCHRPAAPACQLHVRSPSQTGTPAAGSGPRAAAPQSAGPCGLVPPAPLVRSPAGCWPILTQRDPQRS